jgi:hypothetical protein
MLEGGGERVDQHGPRRHTAKPGGGASFAYRTLTELDWPRTATYFPRAFDGP